MPKKITIRGVIGFEDTATPSFLARELESADGESVELEFNSPGGFVFAGLEMANMVRNYRGRVTARIVGLAASMSSYIPMMADEVIVEDNAVFMIHNPRTMAAGDQHDMSKAASRLEALAGLLAKAYTKKTGKDMAAVREMMDQETFLFGDEIVEHGFADMVIEGSDDKDKAQAVAVAEEEIKACIDIIKEAEGDKESDDKIAALLKIDTTESRSENNTQPPAPEAGKTQEEEANEMPDLKKFLADNPEAKAEYDAALEAHGKEQFAAGETAGKEEIQGTIKAVAPYLNSEVTSQSSH
jgi:ATP-dependent protease ClpP protease subunit